MQQNKALAKAKEAFEKAAIGQERQGSNWHAAKDIEKAADIAREMGLHTELPKLYRQAAEYYALESRLQAAAETLSKGAKFVAENDSQVYYYPSPFKICAAASSALPVLPIRPPLM